MSILAWALGLAAYDELSRSADESEAARREAEDLRRRNDANERRIDRLERELRELKGGQSRTQRDGAGRESRAKWRN